MKKIIGTLECDDNLIKEAIRAFVTDFLEPGMKIVVGEVRPVTDNDYTSWYVDLIDVSEDKEVIE